ncbi:MAG: tetratricopeptide repeat protein [Burkholderiales bacterium]|jgi:Flp pilus assembly protein TadD|nr:tetratricopeptide repeat protein [Burkholderiales bacterium]
MNVFMRWWLGLLANIALTLGMKRRALELYREIALHSPKDPRAGATLGSMLMEAGESSAAAQAFERVLAHNPDYADGWFNLGFIHEQRDNVAEAERCFRRAVELNPNHDRAWYGLALVLIRTERLREAVEALKKNIKLQPFSPYGFYQLGMTYHHLGEAGDAWRTYEQLKLFEPKYAATLKRDLETTKPRRLPAANDDSASLQSDEPHPKEVRAASN